MACASSRQLTERQRAVMERIDRRVPIKVIAQELGVSETRINQHIRTLKDIYRAHSLGELVENYRATIAPDPADQPSENGPVGITYEPSLKDFSEAAYIKKQINVRPLVDECPGQDDPGQLVMGDVLPLVDQAPWLRPGEPRVVPGVLDGDHAVLFRLVAIVGIAAGILAAVVLTVTAAVALSEATDGRATIPLAELNGPG